MKKKKKNLSVVYAIIFSEKLPDFNNSKFKVFIYQQKFFSHWTYVIFKLIYEKENKSSSVVYDFFSTISWFLNFHWKKCGFF